MNEASTSSPLSLEGREFLSDPVMYQALFAICEELKISPEEYLIRFEEVINEEPNKIFSLF